MIPVACLLQAPAATPAHTLRRTLRCGLKTPCLTCLQQDNLSLTQSLTMSIRCSKQSSFPKCALFLLAFSGQPLHLTKISCGVWLVCNLLSIRLLRSFSTWGIRCVIGLRQSMRTALNLNYLECLFNPSSTKSFPPSLMGATGVHPVCQLQFFSDDGNDQLFPLALAS